jgi:hypothetical protein
MALITMQPEGLLDHLAALQAASSFVIDFQGRCPGLLHFQPFGLRSMIYATPL